MRYSGFLQYAVNWTSKCVKQTELEKLNRFSFSHRPRPTESRLHRQHSRYEITTLNTINIRIITADIPCLQIRYNINENLHAHLIKINLQIVAIMFFDVDR